jgi:hypothetical protein
MEIERGGTRHRGSQETNSMVENRSLETEDNQTKHKQMICTVSRKEEEQSGILKSERKRKQHILGRYF